MTPSLSDFAQRIPPFHVMALLERAQALSAQGHDVIHLEVGPGLVDDPDGHERRATVLVEIEGFDSDQVLKREVRVQHWYKQSGTWYVVEGERVGLARQ